MSDRQTTQRGTSGWFLFSLKRQTNLVEGVGGGCGGGGGRVLPDSVVVFMCPEVLVKPCRRMRAKRITGIDRIAASRISEGVKRDRMLREELTHQPHRTKINTN